MEREIKIYGSTKTPAFCELAHTVNYVSEGSCHTLQVITSFVILITI